jgi:hypothetical protein
MPRARLAARFAGGLALLAAKLVFLFHRLTR